VLVERLLAQALPDRWAHSRGVGLKARELRLLAGEHADVLEAAAFLHDIGYAPEVRDTGFHPLDGARYLREETDAPALVCTLVANHTCAVVEAEGRGLAGWLTAEFPVGESPEPELVAAITHCDPCQADRGVRRWGRRRCRTRRLSSSRGTPWGTCVGKARIT